MLTIIIVIDPRVLPAKYKVLQGEVRLLQSSLGLAAELAVVLTEQGWGREPPTSQR